MTAWSTVELAVEAMRRGGSDFVTKPWDNETLLATIRRNLAPERPTGATPETEAREARRVQRGLLPARIPAPEGYLIHPTWHPAGAVGGDYYDVIELEAGRLAFAIGDVSGKGMPAALLMANIQAAVRAAARQAWGPALVCRRLNREVFDNTPTERFVSFFYGVLDLGTGSIRYSNAGHPPPVSIQADGGVVRLDEGGRVLGLFADADYGEGEVRIGPGGRLTLFTDGVTEAENARNEEFGDGRLVELLAGNRTLSCPDLHARLMEAVVGFAGGLSDDATLLTLAANR
jgi:sigma-B regulation protein RsbU (phosphoserine phosphatase)